MSSSPSRNVTLDPAAARDEWLERLSNLIESVQTWAEELDWSTRRIEKELEDSEIGSYRAPALLLQKETNRLFLEPIARSAPGADGIVDLYRMPAYDDVATLYYVNGSWELHRASTGANGESPGETPGVAFSKSNLQSVIGELTANGETAEPRHLRTAPETPSPGSGPVRACW